LENFASHSAAGLRDVDGDGRGDLIIGGCGWIWGEEKKPGEVCACSGSTGETIYSIHCPKADNHFELAFGGTVASVADLDGDGKDEIIVGAHTEWEEQILCGSAKRIHGRAWIFSGVDGRLLATLKSPNSEALIDSFGSSIASLPDMDGDSLTEILIGAPGANRAYIFPSKSFHLADSSRSPKMRK